MQPKLTLLSNEMIARILEEAYELLRCPGVKVQNPEARDLLAEAGAILYPDNQVIGIPAVLIHKALDSVPREFYLYDYDGNPAVHYGGDSVHFDPGSSGIAMLNPETLEHETTETRHLIRLLKVAEQLQQYDAQSTAVICQEVPKDIQDSYRLYLTLLYSKKPIVTGAFTNKTVQEMIDMLAVFAGSPEAAREKPRAIFDVCPAPPLIWSNFGSGNLIALARAGIPAEIVSVPLAGAAAPVTMLGTITQHTAECLAGITNWRGLALPSFGEVPRPSSICVRGRHPWARSKQPCSIVPMRKLPNHSTCPRIPILAQPIPNWSTHRPDSKAELLPWSAR